MTEIMLDSQYFIASEAKMSNHKTEKAMDDKSKREDRRRKFVEDAYSKNARSASSGNQRETVYFNERKKKKADTM